MTPALATASSIHKRPAHEQDARSRLIEELASKALKIGRVTLSSGRIADYYVDAKRAIQGEPGYSALGKLVSAKATELGATAVGGLVIGADAVAFAALQSGTEFKVLRVRKAVKAHGLERRIEGDVALKSEGPLMPSDVERCLIVDDVVTTGGSVLAAIRRVRDEGHEVVGVLAVLDRQAGGRDLIEAELREAPYIALTTIDDVYPDRPDSTS